MRYNTDNKLTKDRDNDLQQKQEKELKSSFS
jgi:hypothetical protein